MQDRKYFEDTRFPLKISYILDGNTRKLFGITKTTAVPISQEAYTKLLDAVHTPDSTNKIACFLCMVNYDYSATYIYNHDGQHYVVQIFID
jgi:hypothetical protein